ncbi:MAG: hypothetical protein ACRC68_02675, partial [Clostridium sp.]
KSDVSELKSDVSELKSDVSELKSDVSELKSDVSELKSDVSELKSDVSELKSDVSELKSDVEVLKEVQSSHTIILEGLDKKMHSVYDQTADLSEFRTETKDMFDKTHSKIDLISTDIIAVEAITGKNMADIAHLKLIK